MPCVCSIGNRMATPITIMLDPKWNSPLRAEWSTDDPTSLGDPAYFYMDKSGCAILEWVDKTTNTKHTAKFNLDDFDRFKATVKSFNITVLDCKTRMEGYTWLPEWIEFVSEAFYSTWTTQ